ncbi:branched-chain amino acid ABC transporter permease [Thermoflexus sp.]|uniref:branched-chain amino acid ABC transporter permease n=1 Tax=Thermoflexus sp. TaxID=1969742 RepID=UPI0035E40524
MKGTWALVLILVGIIGFLALILPLPVWASIVLSGLTLAALFFLVASGLSLIFGLMDVINFAHGTLFMLGAYVGWTAYQNPRLLLNTAPLFLALGAGIVLGQAGAGRFPIPRIACGIGLISFGAIAFWNHNVGKLVAFGSTVPGGSIPTPLAQEPFAIVFARMVAMGLAGSWGGLLLGGARRAAAKWAGGLAAGLFLIGTLMVLSREMVERWVLESPPDLRFLLALSVGTLVGGALGALIESTLIRPLYARPIYQVLLTLGLSYVGTELVRVVWGPGNYAPLPRPSLFAAPCLANSLGEWFAQGCASLNVLGRPFPTYRLLIIGVGIGMWVGIGLLLRWTRIGMAVRAAVEDREMVEALGIPVRRLFTGVFAMGSALAALGGVVATPFLGLSPAMGLEFLLQAFIAVVIGGMGHYGGAAVGALLVGLARAFGDYLVTVGVAFPGLTEAIRFSPAIARASTVLIMAAVLLIRPSGLFGQKSG